MSVLRILMVDDDWMDVELLEEFLADSNLDFELEHAADGIEALRKLRDPDPLPHLVVLDLNMPGKDGIQTLREIRKDRRLWKLAVLIYTTSQQDLDKTKAFESRANYFITKPTEPEEYEELVQFLKDFRAQYLQKE